MVLRLAAQMGQSLLNTASSELKFAFIIAAESSPQHKGVAGFRKGHAVLRSAFACVEVIGAGA